MNRGREGGHCFAGDQYAVWGGNLVMVVFMITRKLAWEGGGGVVINQVL